MSILKANIITFLNRCMEDDVSPADATEAIKLCLRDLSSLGLLDGVDTTITLNLDDSGELKTSDLDLYFDVPDEYKDIETIALSDTAFTDSEADTRLDSAETYDPLVVFYKEHEEYRKAMALSAITGTPTQYSEYEKQIYLYPPPDKAYDVLVEFQKYDDQDPDNIEFDDEFSNCIKFGSVYFYAMMKSRERYATIWKPQYENEKQFCLLNKKKQKLFVKE